MVDELKDDVFSIEEWRCIRSEVADGSVTEQWANEQEPELQFGFRISLAEISLASFTDPVGWCRKHYCERHGIRGKLLDPPSYTRLQLSVV